MSTDFSDVRKKPRIEAEDDDLVIYFRLCDAGYAQSIADAAKLDARTVIQALYYEKFKSDYEQAYIEINKE